MRYLLNSAASPYLTVSSLGTTPGGQELKIATITDPAYDDSNKFKAYAIAQQHAGEIPGSWNAEGMIRFLLSNDSTAQAIRRSYIFKIIPITNVDGVYYGRSRYTPLRDGVQYDLNRWWDHSVASMPFEVKVIFEDIQTWQPDSFNDFHSTINTEQISPRDALTYTWSTSDPVNVNFMNKIIEGGWPETVRSVSGYACSQVHSRLGVPRSVSFENPHDELKTMVPLRKLAVNDWMDWGKAYVKGVYLDSGVAYGSLSVTTEGSGTVAKNPDSATYTYGTAVELTATASDGWFFSYWSGNLTGSANPATVIINGDLSFQAHFNQEITHTITASFGTGGSITPSGAVVANDGEDKTFTITSDTGYHILDVLVDGGSVGAVTSYTFFAVTADHTISASFALDTFTITASVGSGGDISPSGVVTVNYGADQTFTIDPETGFHITDVIVDDVSQGIITSYTFYVVTANHTISTTFAINTYTITATAGTGGSIDPSGTVIVAHGTDQTFTITSNTNYHILDVLVDGGSVGPASSYTFIDVVADHNIQASFAEDPLRLWMPFDDSTLPIPDESGYWNSGTPYGNAAWIAGYGGCYNFDGNGDYVKINSNPSIDGGWNEITIEHWVKFSANNNGVKLVSKRGSTSALQSYQTGFQTSGPANVPFFGLYLSSGYGEWTSDISLQNNQWYHLAFTWVSNTTYKLYINGVEDAAAHFGGSSNKILGPIKTSTGEALYLGTRLVTTPYFNGLVDDVRVYSNAFSSAEILQHYNEGSADHTEIYSILASAGIGGSITPSGDVQVVSGADQGFVIAADVGYHILDVLVDGGSVGAVSSYTFVDVVADHLIVAQFEQDIVSYSILASAGVGGSITPSGDVQVVSGADQGFVIAADVGYHILDVLVDGGSVGAVSSYTFVDVVADHLIVAQFEQDIVSYSILASAGVGGSITPSGDVQVVSGADQTFTIAPNEGYIISQLWVDGIIETVVSSYTFTNVQANHQIDVYFTPITYNITASAGLGGSISPNGIVSVNYGEDKTFTIIPDVGYQIQDVVVDSVSQGVVNSYTFLIIVTDHTISASFQLSQYLVDSMYDVSVDSAELRANSSTQDWYESRGAFPTGADPTLLTLDTNNIGGNTGKKAGLKDYGITGKNAYLTQEFSSIQSAPFSVSFDIYIDKIEDNSNFDRSGHVYIGDDSVKTNCPTGTANERFVHITFYDPTPGDTGDDIEIRARTSSGQSATTTSAWTQITTGLSYDTWYIIKLLIYPSTGKYDVYVNNVLVGNQINKYSGYASSTISLISFSSDSDGRGDFFIDNVYSPPII